MNAISVGMTHQRWRYAWLAWVLLSLLPLWCVGLFERSVWTPDEPREAAIAWRMSGQANWALPELGSSRFLEKPPLSYWLAALSLRVFGDSPAALRVPNLLYALVATSAIALLVFAMAGRNAAITAALLAGSMFQMVRVEIWLATDAPLLAGCAVALLGLYRGYTATDSRAQLTWYTLMHLGALIAFMSKSAIGWLVPGLTLLTLTIWERRTKEWLNWRLWLGFVLQLVAIGAWIVVVLQQRLGFDALRMLFWNNLAGRFAHIPHGAAPNYAAAHVNWPGKYLVELPYYLFPWTLLLIAALARAYSAWRGRGDIHTAWRFAVASWLPFVVVLSCAVTARDVYIAPALLGVCMMIGLWLADASPAPNSLNAWCLRGTRYLAASLLGIVTIACIVLTMNWSAWPIRMFVIGITATLVLSAIWMLRRAAHAQHTKQYFDVVLNCYAVTLLALTVGLALWTPSANHWQDLRRVAFAVRRDTGHAPLALLLPDETTIAMMDHYAHCRVTLLDGKPGEAQRLLNDWFTRSSNTGRALLLLPGHTAGPLSHWLKHGKAVSTTDDGLATTLEKEHAVQIVARYELPYGRRYALLAPVGADSVAHSTTLALDAPCIQTPCIRRKSHDDGRVVGID